MSYDKQQVHLFDNTEIIDNKILIWGCHLLGMTLLVRKF